MKLTHFETAIQLGRLFAENFPQSSFGISGSVANSTHNNKSDLDLLLLDNSFKKNRQYIFTYNEIEVNLLCLNEDIIKNKLNSYMWFFNIQHLGYIKNCKIICDVNGQLARLVLFVNDLLMKKFTSPHTLMENTETMMDEYLKEGVSLRDHQILEVVKLMLSYLFLKTRKIVLDKHEAVSVFNDLFITNRFLYDYWKKHIPL